MASAARDDANSGVYNLGDSEVVSLLELAELLVDVNGGGSYRLVPFPPERQAIDIGDYYSEFSKIRGELGWEPRVPLRDGLERTLDFYRESGSKYWDDA